MNVTQDPHQHPPAATSAAAAGDNGNGNGTRRWFMRGVIIATVLLCAVMVALLYYRWVKVKQPTAMVAIHGGKELAGATVTAEALFLPKPYEFLLDEHGNGRFFPQPGEYTIRIHYGDARDIVRHQEQVLPGYFRRIDFQRNIAATRPWLRE